MSKRTSKQKARRREKRAVRKSEAKEIAPIAPAKMASPFSFAAMARSKEMLIAAE